MNEKGRFLSFFFFTYNKYFFSIYSFSADLFCLGCVIYEMMTLRYPFAGTSADSSINFTKLYKVIIIIIIIIIII
jgi:serine/threonine protein kinase